MCAYHRAKREDAIEPSKKGMSIKIGCFRDSLESLLKMCYDKSVELLKSIEIDKGEKMEVVFWTNGIPELICVATFVKNEDGLLSFSLDDSESTL